MPVPRGPDGPADPAVAIFGPEDDPHDPVALRILEAVISDSVQPKGGTREPAGFAGVERHASGIPTRPGEGTTFGALPGQSEAGVDGRPHVVPTASHSYAGVT
jgi:hypothetical protein